MTRRRWATTAPLAAALTGTALAFAPLRAQEETEAAPRIQAVLDGFLDRSGAPGVSVAWTRADGTMGEATAGESDVSTGRRLRARDRFHVGSVGKTFTAAVVISLVLDGSLELDDPISRWLGEEPWYPELPNAGALTLRHLLSHTSGIPDHVDDPEFGSALDERLSGPDPDPDFGLRPEELVGFVLDQEPLFEPGRSYAYSDTNYILLGLVVERVTGRRFYDVLGARFLEPLELDGIVPATGPSLEKLVTGYNRDAWLGLPEVMVRDGELVVDPTVEWTGGGLISTARDLVRWIRALAEGRTVLGREGFDLMRTGAPPGAGDRYGLGLSLGRSGYGPTVGHDGIFPGYRARLAYFPEHDLAVAALVNQSPADPGKLVERIAGALLLDPASETAVDADPGASSRACTDPSGQGITGVWPVEIPLANGRTIRGTLDLHADDEGELRGSFTQAGMVEDGTFTWSLRGRLLEGRFELASEGGPSGPAASEMADVDRVIIEGRVTERGISGEYFVVLEGRRYDRDAAFGVARRDCEG